MSDCRIYVNSVIKQQESKVHKFLLDFYEKRILSSDKTVSFNRKHVPDQRISHKFQSRSFEMRGQRDVLYKQFPRCNEARPLPIKGLDILHVSVNTQLLPFSALNYEIT
jgi:hypothetical protein